MQGHYVSSHLNKYASIGVLALLLALAAEVFAGSVTTLAGNRVRLTQMEIQSLGFLALFEPRLPTAQLTKLYLVVPDRIDGRRFIDATVELVDLTRQTAPADITLAINEAGEKVLVIDSIDPANTDEIELELQYGADLTYEVSIDVASLNAAEPPS